MVHATKTKSVRPKQSPVKSPARKSRRGSKRVAKIVSAATAVFFDAVARGWLGFNSNSKQEEPPLPFPSVPIEFGGVAYLFPLTVATDADMIDRSFYEDRDGNYIYVNRQTVLRPLLVFPVKASADEINRLFAYLDRWNQANDRLGRQGFDPIGTASMVIIP